MAVQLKQATVIESLRSARRADDGVARLRENSLEERLVSVKQLVESSDWKHGPAAIVATFAHHAVARTTDGNLVRVEWRADKLGKCSLGRSTIFESTTPAPDIGAELFHTAAAAVDRIMAEDYDSLDPMISSMAEALDMSGDLQRRVVTEVALRAINRNAWWHSIVSEHFSGSLLTAPAPRMDGPDVLRESYQDLVLRLKESAGVAAAALRTIDTMPADPGVSSVASDIANDITNAISALLNVESDNESEIAAVYESVLSVADYLLTGAKFLSQIAASNTDRE
jgi:hypothetical protein